MQLTPDQNKVVVTRNKDILVSAAAGSGKTAVLIQRIISRITDKEHPVDVDRMLIVTFTNAAAAEMRERLHKAILEKLDVDPENDNLQRQATLIHNALITTIDSFCLFLLRNHFHEINLDPAFRVADPNEMKLIKKQVLEDTLESFYEEADPLFLEFSDVYCPNGKDGKLEKTVEGLYEYSMSHPWPLEWLDQCKGQSENLTDENVFKTQWMQYGWQYIRATIQDCLEMAKMALGVCERPAGPYMYAEAFESDIQTLQNLLAECDSELTKKRYDNLLKQIEDIKWKTLSRAKDPSVDESLKELANDTLRKEYKALIGDISKKLFPRDLTSILMKESLSQRLNCVLIDITKRFIENLQEVKREKNIVDFSDAEHMALSILCEDGKPTNTALSYRDYFEEIMIDEYQDSNMVQEFLLSSIARETENSHNRFMVGDMKQSIYRFRLACPKLFLDKYMEYQDGSEQHTLISLKKNFRSRKEVLDSVNDVFYRVMRPQVGDIEYNQDAALYLGADFGTEDESEPDRYKTQMLLLEKNDLKGKQVREAEATMIAKKIKEMVGSFPVVDTKKQKKMKAGDAVPMRPATYRDIVILIRSEKNVSQVMRDVLMREGIPVYITSKSGYFTTLEISTIMDLLRVINNPYDEIPFCAAMMSMFFGFTNEEISQIKICAKQEETLYEAFRKLGTKEVDESIEQSENEKESENVKAFENEKESVNKDATRNADESETNEEMVSYKLSEELQTKIQDAMTELDLLRNVSLTCTMPELLEFILFRYHYLEYITALPAGQQRRANLEMFIEKAVEFEKTSFHGLFHFIRYMQQLRKYDVDFGEASTLAETADVVRIMTIHKSKGLEFPICFVAGIDHGFNMRDTSDSVLLDIDWGVASNYVEKQHHLSGKTLRKALLSTKLKRDSLGEELRVLYVAMTRAKEKLILTGVVDSLEDACMKYDFLSGVGDSVTIPGTVLAGGGSYLDYLLMTHAIGTNHIELIGMDLEQLGIDTLRDMLTLEEKSNALQKLQDFENEIEGNDCHEDDYVQLKKELKEKLSFLYQHDNLIGLGAKTSVSELKKAAMEEAGIHPMFETDIKGEPYYPPFVQQQIKQGGTARGSAYHRVLEMLDFAKYNDLITTSEDFVVIKQLENDLEKLKEDGLIQEEYVELVPLDRIVRFLKSDVASDMAKAQREGTLMKEQPFVLSISADRLNKNYPPEESVLIQGIIDVFYEKDDEIVILDYKTDRIESMEQLLKRYRTQLDYYEEAVERITGKKVKEKVLYSFSHMDKISWK